MKDFTVEQLPNVGDWLVTSNDPLVVTLPDPNIEGHLDTIFVTAQKDKPAARVVGFGIDETVQPGERVRFSRQFDMDAEPPQEDASGHFKMPMKWVRYAILALLLSGCASTVEPEPYAADANTTDAAPDSQQVPDSQPTDAARLTRGAYVGCDSSNECPPDLACNRGVCTMPCTEIDMSFCPIPPFGSQVVCSELRCLLACGGNLTCGDGTACQRVGANDVCTRP